MPIARNLALRADLSMQSSIPHEFAQCGLFDKIKVRIPRDDKVAFVSQNANMSRARKDKPDYEALDVEYVPDNYEVPPHHLREWRIYRKLTLEQLGELVGTTKGVVHELENTKRELGRKWLWKFSKALRIRPGFILEYNPESIDTDMIKVWAEIPEEERHKAIKSLKVFARSREDDAA